MANWKPLKANRAGDVYRPGTGDPRESKMDLPSGVSRRSHAYEAPDDSIEQSVKQFDGLLTARKAKAKKPFGPR